MGRSTCWMASLIKPRQNSTGVAISRACAVVAAWVGRYWPPAMEMALSKPFELSKLRIASPLPLASLRSSMAGLRRCGPIRMEPGPSRFHKILKRGNMRFSGFPLLVASSLLWALSASAGTRPHYGGTLHVEMRAAPTFLDPGDSNQADGFEPRNLFSLMFDTLISLNEQGRPEPALASSWQAEPGNQRWRFFLRHGVTFQDGTPVTPDAVAASLRKTNQTWKVFSEGEAVVIERDSPAPNLPAQLTLPRNSIVKRDGGKISGSGPFVVSRWDPGKRLLLAARDDYWGGRPFLDAIDMEMGKNL